MEEVTEFPITQDDMTALHQEINALIMQKAGRKMKFVLIVGDHMKIKDQEGFLSCLTASTALSAHEVAHVCNTAAMKVLFEPPTFTASEAPH